MATAETVLWAGRRAMFRNHPVWFSLALLLTPLGLGLVVLVIWWVICLKTRWTVTRDRTTERRGILSKSTTEMRHSDIRAIDVEQDFFHRLMGAGTVRLSSASSDDFEIAMSGIAKPQERASLLRRLQERLHMPEQPLVRPHNPAPEDNEALAGELAEEEPRSLRGLSTAWGAIRNAMISAGTRVGPPATSAGKWAWTTISALPGRIDRVLKSVAGEGNQLVYHFLQVLAVAAAAAVAGGCALIVFLSVSSFYSWSGFFALLAAATLIIVGGKTTERSRALGGGIAALGLVTLLLSLLFIGVRLLTFRR